MMQFYLGIDVSKAKLDAALLLAGDKFKSKVFPNDSQGFKSLLQWLHDHVGEPGVASVHVCMEATGVYHEPLACYLHDQGLVLSVINPLLVKRFAEATRQRNKTDQVDARCLALFGKSNRPEPWEAPSAAVRALQALVARMETLQTMRQAECNRLDVAHHSVASSIERVIAELDAAIAQVKAQIARTIDDDPDLKQRARLLDTIPGLGEKTIPRLLAYIGRPERFKSVKALIAYASLAPMIRQSGTSLDKRKGTHPLGHRALKNILFYPAMVAGSHNPVVAAFWKRLKAQHKPGKLIVEACMHKLLAIAYGVLKSGKPFDPKHLKGSNA